MNGVAQKAGISVQAVSSIETGTNSPSISTFVRLCDADDVVRRLYQESKHRGIPMTRLANELLRQALPAIE